MNSSKDHENFFYIAKLNEQAKSYNKIMDVMKKVVKIMKN